MAAKENKLHVGGKLYIASGRPVRKHHNPSGRVYGLQQSGGGKNVKSGWILMCSTVEATGFLTDF